MLKTFKAFPATVTAVIMLAGAPLHAAEVTVLSAAAVKGPVSELAAEFERTTGHQVRFEFSTAGGVDAKVKAAARPDLVINARQRLDALAAEKWIAPAMPRDLGVVKMGVAVRKGGQIPDLGSTAGLRAALLSARSITYGDPAKGPTTGIHFARVVEQLGLTDALRSKTVLAADGLEVMRLVARGEVELGITQISEIVHVAPETLAGALPEAVQLNTVYSIARGSETAGPAAQQFLDLLVSPAGHERFIHAGFQ